jgi:hypothetical protein
MAAEWRMMMDSFLASSLDPETTPAQPQPRSLPDAEAPDAWQQPTTVRSSLFLKTRQFVSSLFSLSLSLLAPVFAAGT